MLQSKTLLYKGDVIKHTHLILNIYHSLRYGDKWQRQGK